MIRSLTKTAVVFFLASAVFAGGKSRSLFCVPVSPAARGSWVAKAELALDTGLKTVHYYRARAITGEQVLELTNNPEEKGRCENELDAATRWLTAQAVPCAVKLS
ncbi:hypothetical protein FTW19_14715 [Terriglobus albidus]|uniref:Uncharacterized protein n=1 Tax=Terriglobus albidus TaxID=1592106 RepID=A0A5B9EGF0_9BACT|nr:hypothetical protein [Terriglobus albidus]QEE29136.1 hypothetical protein FTW19_14715 [Terriglobus albidus]